MQFIDKILAHTLFVDLKYNQGILELVIILVGGSSYGPSARAGN